MASFLFLLSYLLLVFGAECSQIPGNRAKLLDSSTPAYHGTNESPQLDLEHFSRSLISSDYPLVKSYYFDLLSDELIIEIFDYLRNDFFYLFPRLIYSCKRFYLLIGKFFMSRFTKLSPQLFVLVPPQFRLAFAMKYLWDFEVLFSDGIKNDFMLNKDEICGLMFVVLHLRNQLYIPSNDLDFVEAVKTGRDVRRTHNKFMNVLAGPSSSLFSTLPCHRLPFAFPKIWRSVILSYCVHKSLYFSIESICKFDPSTINWTIDLILKRGQFNEKDKMLLRTILNISNDQNSLKYLLNQSIFYKNVSVFKEFLPIWTGSLASLTENATDAHIIMRMALNDLTLPELLDIQEIRHNQFLLCSTLKECEKHGNYKLATDLIIKFPSQFFLNLYEPQIIDLIRQIITLQRLDGDDLPVRTQVTLAMLLASFHFPQREILEVFKRLMRDGRVNDDILEKLSLKRTMMYYESVKGRRFCTIS